MTWQKHSYNDIKLVEEIGVDLGVPCQDCAKRRRGRPETKKDDRRIRQPGGRTFTGTFHYAEREEFKRAQSPGYPGYGHARCGRLFTFNKDRVR